MNKTVNLAFISICLYASLACTCLYFALTFWDFRTGELRGGRYATPKFVFFVVLCISAILDIPLFVGCIVQGGPIDCEWNSSSYVAFWLFHLLATCGYTYAIITPPILWSDIIQHKDGNLWNSAYPLDSTKLFFRVVFVIFCINELTTVVGSTMYQDPDHQADYTKSNPVGAISEAFTPIITTTVTVGCLWSGIALQRHVVSVGLRGSTQFKILVQLNITMLIIAVTYIMRSLLVLCLYSPMPESYVRLFHPLRSSFFLWLLWTRWLPCVFCSFCLVHEMRFKGAGTQGASPSEGGPSMQQGLLKGERSSGGGTAGGGAGGAGAGARAISTDSALEETYSMLSSVDLPGDIDSDASSTYLLSPTSSPDRVGSRSRSARQSGESGVDAGPWGEQRSGVMHSSVSAAGVAEEGRSRSVRTGERRSGRKRIPRAEGTAGAGTGAGTRTGTRSGKTWNPSDVLESPSSGSDTDFAYYGGMRSPPRTSVDHFFTFSAPHLDISTIGAGASAAGAGASADHGFYSQGSANTGTGGAGANSSGHPRSSMIPIPAPLPISIQSTVQQGGGTVSGSASRTVMSFSPPSWRGPAASFTPSNADFINADERTSPEISSKTL